MHKLTYFAFLPATLYTHCHVMLGAIMWMTDPITPCPQGSAQLSWTLISELPRLPVNGASQLPGSWFALPFGSPYLMHTSITVFALLHLPGSVTAHLWKIMSFVKKAGSTSCSHRPPSCKSWHCTENMLLKGSATVGFSPFLKEKNIWRSDIMAHRRWRLTSLKRQEEREGGGVGRAE